MRPKSGPKTPAISKTLDLKIPQSEVDLVRRFVYSLNPKLADLWIRKNIQQVMSTNVGKNRKDVKRVVTLARSLEAMNTLNAACGIELVKFEDQFAYDLAAEKAQKDIEALFAKEPDKRHATTTGRWSCSTPNLSNLPRLNGVPVIPPDVKAASAMMHNFAKAHPTIHDLMKKSKKRP